jgi:hypothetical protein
MSVLAQVQGLPGARAAKTVLHRAVMLGAWVPDVLPAGKYLAGDASRDPGNTPDVGRIRSGMMIGKISSVVNSLGTVGYYAPSVIDVTAGAKAAGDTTVTISAAGAVELARRCGATGTFKLRGPAIANGVSQVETVTYSAINTTTGAITVTAIVNSYVAGAFVQPTDGSEDILTMLVQGYPLQATDFDGTSLTAQQIPELAISGVVKASQLLPVWPSDTSLQAYIISRICRPGGGNFTFDTNY